MAVSFIAGERGAEGLDGVAGEDGDAVVGLLGNGRALVADGFEDVGGEVCALELLQQQDVRCGGLQPGGDVVEPCAD